MLKVSDVWLILTLLLPFIPLFLSCCTKQWPRAHTSNGLAELELLRRKRKPNEDDRNDGQDDGKNTKGEWKVEKPS